MRKALWLNGDRDASDALFQIRMRIIGCNRRPYNRHSLPSLSPVDANLCANTSACPSRILSQNRTLSLRDVFYLVAATTSYLVIAAKVDAEARVIPATLAFAASPNRASFGECRA